VKKGIYSVPPQQLSSTWEGKALMCRWFEDLYSAANALGLCIFPFGFNLALGPTHLSKLFSACTGRETTPEGMIQLGQKVFTLLKACAVRQGFTRKDDTWPDRFFEEPLPEGPAQGAILSKATIDRLLDEYYDLRQWDRRLGMPTEDKLIQLGLRDVAALLKENGKLP
jgi:aldehyde:ferredoxin oxidoreductase